eukprot:jgi/Bigna1/80558/fgenesh1_pg.72_\
MQSSLNVASEESDEKRWSAGVGSSKLLDANDTSILSFETKHGSNVHCLQYDFYGKRLATSSSDRRIRIWDSIKGEGQSWKLASELPRVHTSSIVKVIWGSVDFGSVLASASRDGSVCIYEECSAIGTGRKFWRQRHKIIDAGSKGCVLDISFGPARSGELRLAICTRGSNAVRIYKASNITQWSLNGKYVFDGTDTCSSVSWCPSVFDPPMMMVAAAGGMVHICREISSREEVLWEKVCELPLQAQKTVLSVAWAPNPGVHTHRCATACSDHKIRIYGLKTSSSWTLNGKDLKKGPASWSEAAEVRLEGELTSHGAPVWSVSWDTTGTNLASMDEKGKICLWSLDTSKDKISWKLLEAHQEKQRKNQSANANL